MRFHTALHTSLSIALAIGMVSCSNDNDIKDVPPPFVEVTLPQGGNATADATIQSLYDQYGSYFMYKFKPSDMNWTMTSGGMFDTQYRYTAIRPDSVPNLLSAIKSAWLDLYPDEFNRRHLPKFIYMTQTLDAGELSYSFALGEFTTAWHPIKARYLTNQIAIANIPSDWSAMTPEEHRDFKRNIQCVALNYYVSAGAIRIPDDFYAVSTYGTEALRSATAARNEGFIIDPATDNDWALNTITVTRDQDIEAYMNAIAFYSASDWRTVYSGRTKIKQKYDILIQALAEAGIDANTIAEY